MNIFVHFQLFLFDFDGLLVDTEPLHFAAYQRLCQELGYELSWDFTTYTLRAQKSNTGIEEGFYEEFPKLREHFPNWSTLYLKKKKHYMDLLGERPVSLLPGAETLLNELHDQKIQHCVVTHSPLEQIKVIRKMQPLLDQIPHWFTREDYKNAKPSPDGYLKAIGILGKPGDNIIGFEDSYRGYLSLQQTPATPILVCPENTMAHQELPSAIHFPTLATFLEAYVHQK